jgi:ribonuclease BN (tRNA processing enzyme)
MAVPVNHTVNAIGCQVRDDAGKALFYTGDTGPGLSDCWEHLSFQLLIIDTTFPNDYERYARDTGHLTPNLLLAECIALRKIKKSLPRIICMHRDPLLGNKVEKEIAEVAAALDSPITVARENMEVVL